MTLKSSLRGPGQQGARRILISGSSGLIGRAVIASRRRAGDVVVPLVRAKGTADALIWDPGSGTLNPATCERLRYRDPSCGRTSGRALDRLKEASHNGEPRPRNHRTRQCTRLSSSASTPVLVCVGDQLLSAIKVRTVLDETAPSGQGFLAEVCNAWEAASKPLTNRSRIVHLRIGVVLAGEGGMLPRLLPVFRVGLGATVGDGRGYVSWVALEDLVRIIDHLIETSSIDGPVNVVAPEPVISEAFNRAIGSAVGSKVRIRVPAWPFRLLLGQLADETILGSVRAIPGKLMKDGFRFHRDSLEDSLAENEPASALKRQLVTESLMCVRREVRYRQ